MSYVLIYGGLRLDLDMTAMREMKLRPGQHVPDDLVGECIRAQARQVCLLSDFDDADENSKSLAAWAFSDRDPASTENASEQTHP